MPTSFSLWDFEDVREVRLRQQRAMDDSQRFVGDSYGLITGAYRTKLHTWLRAERTRALIEEVDSELKNYRETGRFTPGD